MNEVQVNIPYQEKHNRLSVLLRPFLALPIIVVMLLMIIPNPAIDHRRAISETSSGISVDGSYGAGSESERQYFDLWYIYTMGQDHVEQIINMDQDRGDARSR